MAVGDKKPVVMGADIGAAGGVAGYDATQAALAMKTPVYGKGVNLLDNGDFRNPINQRGQTEYTGAGYTIDRWRSNGGGTLFLESNGLKLVSSAENDLQCIQYVENKTDFWNKTVTISAIIDKILYSRTGVAFNSNPDWMFAINTPTGAVWAAQNAENQWPFVKMRTSPGVSALFTAVKLELGTEQTLAHQDENGNWVLNDPPPNYQQELAKCQRYYQPITQLGIQRIRASAYSANYLYFALPTAVPFRVTPTIVNSDKLKVASLDDVKISGFVMNIDSRQPGSVGILASKNAHGLTDAQLVVFFDDNIGLSADL